MYLFGYPARNKLILLHNASLVFLTSSISVGWVRVDRGWIHAKHYLSYVFSFPDIFQNPGVITFHLTPFLYFFFKQLSQYLSMRVAPPSCTSYLTSWEGMPLHSQQGDPCVSLLIVSCLLLYIKHSDDTIFSRASITSFGILSFFTISSLLVNP